MHFTESAEEVRRLFTCRFQQTNPHRQDQSDPDMSLGSRRIIRKIAGGLKVGVFGKPNACSQPIKRPEGFWQRSFTILILSNYSPWTRPNGFAVVCEDDICSHFHLRVIYG